MYKPSNIESQRQLVERSLPWGFGLVLTFPEGKFRREDVTVRENDYFVFVEVRSDESPIKLLVYGSASFQLKVEAVRIAQDFEMPKDMPVAWAAPRFLDVEERGDPRTIWLAQSPRN